MEHPMQPLVRYPDGALRFQENQIVKFLLEQGPFDMNLIGEMDFCQADREQFAQLIGYTLQGFGQLPYVSDATWDKADKQRTLMAER